MINFQHWEWIRKLTAFSWIRRANLNSIKIITLVTITLCIFLSLMMNCSCLNRSFQMKNDLSHIKQNDVTDQSLARIREKGEMSVMNHGRYGYSSFPERLHDLKKEGIGNWTHHVFDYIDLKRFHQKIKTKLPKYEKIIKQEASKYGLDWTLIAAVMYQESHFNPKARSYTGVRGLMQLTLPTARELGVKNRLDPVQSIQGATSFGDLRLKRYYKI